MAIHLLPIFVSTGCIIQKRDPLIVLSGASFGALINDADRTICHPRWRVSRTTNNVICEFLWMRSGLRRCIRSNIGAVIVVEYTWPDSTASRRRRCRVRNSESEIEIEIEIEMERSIRFTDCFFSSRAMEQRCTLLRSNLRFFALDLRRSYHCIVVLGEFTVQKNVKKRIFLLSSRILIIISRLFIYDRIVQSLMVLRSVRTNEILLDLLLWKYRKSYRISIIPSLTAPRINRNSYFRIARRK